MKGKTIHQINNWGLFYLIVSMNIQSFYNMALIEMIHIAQYTLAYLNQII